MLTGKPDLSKPAAFYLHDIISGQNGGRGKTERQRIVRFSIRYQAVRSLLFSLLISKFVGVNQCNSLYLGAKAIAMHTLLPYINKQRTTNANVRYELH